MNIQQALAQGRLLLAEASPSAALDAEVLLCCVLNCNSAHLMTWPEKELSEEQLDHYQRLLEQRRQGEPVAHITGQREFWSLNFTVNNSTLIPRPETETLVEFILSRFGDRKKLRLLDMGTGSGAIAIALAKEQPGWQIIGSDISAAALELARHNADQLQCSNVRFIHSDWFDNIAQHDFDIIVSNPPYIADNDPHLQQGDVRFEPDGALTAGPAGMDAIEQLCAQAKHYLAENGWLIIEHGYNQEQQVADCFARYGFTQITQQRDLSGHTRMTAGKR